MDSGVFGESFYEGEENAEKKIEKEKKSVEEELWHFFNQGFYSAEDGLKALRKMEKAWKYHKVKGIEVVEGRKRKGGGRGRRGRPGNGEDLERFHHIKAALRGEGAIQKEMLRKGRFIVATNELDSDKLSDEEALKAYKEQQYAERGVQIP